MEHKRKVYKSTCQERIDTGKAFMKLVKDKEIRPELVLRALKTLVENEDGIIRDADGMPLFWLKNLVVDRNNNLSVDEYKED